MTFPLPRWSSQVTAPIKQSRTPAMVSPHGIQLAVHLVSSFYGDLCSKVCECLLRRGSLTLANIIRFTELSRENVMNCLRVLIHQNCVQAFAIQQEGAFQEAPKIITNYMALFDNIIHKMRAPKFMQIVSEGPTKNCLQIFEGLIQHGRLSINQIIDRSRQIEGSSDPHAVRECFNQLLFARFVERCPAPEPYLAPPSEEEAAVIKKRSKFAKVSQPTTEQRVLEEAAPMESMRFLMEMDDHTENTGKDSASSVSVGKKRKSDALRLDDDVLGANREKEVLWRVNFEELVCCLRHKACISYVKARVGKEAGMVMSAILELSRRSRETRPKAEKTAYHSINDIYDEVIKMEDGVGIDIGRVRATLEQIGCEPSPTDIDEVYSIDLQRIIEMAQNEEVESLVSRRYGKEAYRIFRLLSKKGCVIESDKIADTVFVEKKDAVRILHRLWKDDYLDMEKISTGGARQSLFILWKTNKQSLQKHVLDEMYHAALNLRLRIAHELDQGKEVLQLPRDRLVGEMGKKHKSLVKVRLILESSLINLDDAILLFHDF
ncbi:uncharacterized protein LOC127256521 [Andrographis paniculata]|uniref:uncharacterized protein LOC127256521 n=1 Tax=Andrographis paniculata TaxID=175694 RepID=UPI0021E941D8|nr:uncharacterized protein LOC127256521 [Andrographis paniculata]